jgi:hypothetical protein
MLAKEKFKFFSAYCLFQIYAVNFIRHISWCKGATQMTKKNLLRGLKSAIDKIAEENQVTPDIFPALFFYDAKKFYCDKFFPVYTKQTPVDATNFLLSGKGAVKTTRPLSARLYESPKRPAFQQFKWVSNASEYDWHRDRVFLEFSDYVTPTGNILDDERLLRNQTWIDIASRYVAHYLNDKPIIPRDNTVELSEAICFGDERIQGYIELPMPQIMTKFVPRVASLIPQILNNPNNRRAYDANLLDNVFTYSLMLMVNRDTFRGFSLESDISVVFGKSLIGMLNLPIPEMAHTHEIISSYEQQKRDFYLVIYAGRPIAEEVIRGINKNLENSARFVINDNSKSVITVSFNYVENCVMPQLKEYLEDNPKFVEDCQKQDRSSWPKLR